jgi:hypothetical protein
MKRRPRAGWPLTTRLHVALASMAAVAAIASLVLSGMRTS